MNHECNCRLKHLNWCVSSTFKQKFQTAPRFPARNHRKHKFHLAWVPKSLIQHHVNAQLLYEICGYITHLHVISMFLVKEKWMLVPKNLHKTLFYKGVLRAAHTLNGPFCDQLPRINIAWSRIYNWFLVIGWQNGPFKVCAALYRVRQKYVRLF